MCKHYYDSILPNQIELIDRVDDIYRNTTWNDEFKGYGVQIQQVCGSGSLLFISYVQEKPLRRGLHLCDLSALLSAPLMCGGLPRGSASITRSFLLKWITPFSEQPLRALVCASRGVIEFVPQAPGFNRGPCLRTL